MTNILLLLILIVLIFGAGAVLGFFSFLFWGIVILGILFFIVWAIVDDIDQQKKIAENKRLQKEFEAQNPYAPRKTWFGITIQKVKTETGRDEYKLS